MYKELGITVNTKKSKICKLKRGFKFLKTRFFVTDTGKIIKKPCRDRITCERKKLKKLGKLYELKEVTKEDIERNFSSWTGSMKHRNARKTVFNMTKLYESLFKKGEQNDKN